MLDLRYRHVKAPASCGPARYRVLVLVATFAGLRWRELTALCRDSIDLQAGEIRIVETTAQLDTGTLLPSTVRELCAAAGRCC